MLRLVLTFVVVVSVRASEHRASELLGEWRGTSLCTDRVAAPACKDEIIVYDFTEGAKAGTVHWKADKIIGGERQTMGEFDLTYDGAEGCWKVELETARGRSVWCVAVKGTELTGSAWLMPGKRVVRKVAARRK